MRFGRQCYCKVYNSYSKCPPFARIQALRCLHYPSIASSMTLWSLPCQESSKRFFSLSLLCSLQLWLIYSLLDVTPYLVIDRIKVGAIGSHRSGGTKANVDCSKNRSVTCPVCRCAVLLKDEEIIWHVAHHGQQLLWQEHFTIIAAVGISGLTKIRSVRLSFEMPTDGHYNRSGVQLVANLNFDFAEVVCQHTLGVVGYIIWVLFVNLHLFPTVRKLWKSVRFWQSYHHPLSGPLFGT